MTIQVTYYGHAVTWIQTDQVSLIIDPFLQGNDQAPIGPDAVDPDVIVVTHGHSDHLGDTVPIAKRTGALCIANFEIVSYLQSQGVQNVHPQHIGGGFNYDWGRLQLTIAHHGSSLPDGSYGGNPAGVLLTIAGKTLYHAGDTGLFYDMKLIGEKGIDLAILPIGDNFTMGPDDAHRALELLRPRMVVPIHFDTFDVISQDAQAWVDRARQRYDVDARLLRPGDSLTL